MTVAGGFMMQHADSMYIEDSHKSGEKSGSFIYGNPVTLNAMKLPLECVYLNPFSSSVRSSEDLLLGLII